jgi:hypothetical protein
VTVLSNYAITSSAGGNGSISPSGTTNVCSGTSQAYTITASSGYHIATIVVDGSTLSGGAATSAGVGTGSGSYTFSNVTAAHSISSTFALNCTAAALSGCPGNQTGTPGANPCSAVVSYGTLTVTGNPAPTLSYTFTGAMTGGALGTGSGSAFNTGVTNVTITASNGCGTDATCSFTVSVSGPVRNTNTGKYYCSIQSAINDATTLNAHTITVAAGTYNENVTVTKSLTIQGAGSSTILTPSSSCSGNGITVNAASTILKNLKVSNYNNGIVVAAANVTLDNIESSANCITGIEMGGGISYLIVQNSRINDNASNGLRCATAAQMDHITIDNCDVKSNKFGMNIFAANATGNSFEYISIKNSDFSNNTLKGMYFEKLSNAVIENITMNNSGTDASNNTNAGIDINLKYGSYSNVTIKNSVFTGCGIYGGATSAEAPVVLAVKARDDAPSYNSYPATLSNVWVLNNIISGPQNGIRFGEFGKTNNTPNNVEVHENHLGAAFAYKAIINNTPVTTNASCNWYGTSTSPVIAAKMLGSVAYMPYLINGTDNSAAIGFQPVPSTITLTSAPGTNTQTRCVGAAITSITYATTNVSGVTFSGLPAGVSGSWSSNVATISGTPTAAGVYNYSIFTCSSSATGTITVVTNGVTLAASVSPQYPMAGQETQTIYNYPSSQSSETISVTPAGGTGSYAYSWQKSNCNGSIMTGMGLPANTSSYTWTPTMPNASATPPVVGDTCTFFGDNVYTFTITVSDNNGCIGSATRKLNFVNPWAGDAGTSNVQLCHKVPRSTLTQIIQVSPSLVSSHLGHGDILGNCPVFIGKQILPGEEQAEELHTAYIYPNPTTAVFMLELSEISEQAVVNITDISGKTIQTKTLNKDGVRTATFDMSSYAKGFYLIQVTDGGYIFRDKIVLQ